MYCVDGVPIVPVDCDSPPFIVPTCWHESCLYGFSRGQPNTAVKKEPPSVGPWKPYGISSTLSRSYGIGNRRQAWNNEPSTRDASNHRPKVPKSHATCAPLRCIDEELSSAVLLRHAAWCSNAARISITHRDGDIDNTTQLKSEQEQFVLMALGLIDFSRGDSVIWRRGRFNRACLHACTTGMPFDRIEMPGCGSPAESAANGREHRGG